MQATITATVTRISADTFAVPSQSRSGESWIVKHIAGFTTCDCPAGFYRGHCRHGRAVEQYLIEQNRPMIDEGTRRAAMNLLMAPKHRT